MGRQRTRRWFQYRLRTLLIVVTLAALGMGAFKAYVEPFRKQRLAAAALAEFKARLEYQPGGPAWLRAVAGEDYFLNVVAVDLTYRRFKADDLAVLADLPHVERLYLHASQVDDEGLRHVASLPRLRCLSLWKTSITDEGLAHLAALKHLEVLDIHHTRATEACLEHFRGHPRLQRLIHWFRVGDAGAEALASMPQLRRRVTQLTSSDEMTDEGFRHVGRMPALRYLEVRSPQLTDAGLIHLGRLRRLEHLELHGCSASDRLVAQLATLPALRTLRISEAPITDRCLPALVASPVLKELALNQTNVSVGGVARHFGNPAANLTIGARGATFYGAGTTIRLTPHDAAAEHLQYFPHLESLRITTDPISHFAPGPQGITQLQFDIAGAEWLPRLARLRVLDIQLTLDDADLERIGRVRQLERLHLAGEQNVSPDGMRRLARLEGLSRLELRRCGLTDEHLVFLAELPHLEVLEIPGNPITSGAMDHLMHLSNLRVLNISFCRQIDDEAFRKIGTLRRLERLYAQDTQVTDDGLTYLFDMPYLRDVSVLGSRATQAGMRALRGALPTQGGVVY